MHDTNPEAFPRGGEQAESSQAHATRIDEILSTLRSAPEPKRPSPVSALVQLGVAVLIAATVLGLYLWRANRSHEVKVLVAEATPLIDRGDVVSLRAAEKGLLAALAIDDGHEPAIAALAEVYAMLWIEQGVAEARPLAEQWAAQAAAAAIESSHRYAAEALVALGAGKPAEAERVVNDVIARGGVSERLFYVLGLAKLAQGDPRAARAPLKRATDLRANAPHYARALGDALEDDGDGRDASQAWELAAKANRAYVLGVARDLFSRIRRGDDRKAVLTELARLRSLPATETSPAGMAAIRYTEAAMAYQAATYADALKAIDEAAALAGDTPRVIALRGEILLAQGKTVDGLTALSLAHSKAPRADRYLYLLADALTEAGKLEDLFKLLQAAESGRSDSARYRVALGAASVAKGDWARAKAAYDKALTLEPDQPEALLGHALSSWKQRKYDDALSWFEKAVTAKPKFPEVYEGIGLMWIEQGALSQANTQLDMAEKLFRAVDTDIPRLRRFYAAILGAFSRAGGTSYVRDWTGREKAFREGTQPALP